MNSTTSSAANNEGPLPRAKGRLRLRYAFRGKSVSNCLLMPTFVLGKWRQLSDRLVPNFIVRQMSFLFGAAVIIGPRRRCSSTVKPAVSPFNTLILMSVTDFQVQTWHPLSPHYAKGVTRGIQASALRRVRWLPEALMIYKKKKGKKKIFRCSYLFRCTDKRCGRGICRRSSVPVAVVLALRHLTHVNCCSSGLCSTGRRGCLIL